MDIEKLFIMVIIFGFFFCSLIAYFCCLYDIRKLSKKIAEEEAEKKFQLAYEKSFSLKMKDIESLYK